MILPWIWDLVRPDLECYVHFWALQHQTDMGILERALERASPVREGWEN